MTKKSKKNDNTQQLNFFDLEQNNQTDIDQLEDYDEEFEASSDFDLGDLSSESLGLDGDNSSRVVEENRELLTLKLLRKAIQAKNIDDPVMFDFAKYVLPNLLKLTIGVTAKGGKFFDAIDARRLAEGKEKVRRDNAGDQSLCTHLLNGLFPANLIKKRLQQLDTTVKRVIKELERRIAIASFILHDFEKFKYEWFAMMPEKYHHQNIRQLSLENHREIITIMVPQLGLDTFLFPENPEQWIEYLDDILYIAYNTQRRNDTNLNLSEDGLNPLLDDRKLDCLADLACLADRLASIVKHPQDAENKSLQDILYKLSNGQLKFTYHSIAENRGVLTNIVNNAVMEAYQEIDHLPLLYLPTGVIYLSNANNQISLDTDSLPERVIKGIKELCRGELRRKQTGFGRDGKGMKYADYYSQFFDDLGLMQVALDATLRILRIGKNSVAKSRSEKLMEFQTKGILSKDDNFQFEDDLRIDQLAEFGDVVTRKIWGDRREKIELVRKQNKDKKSPALPDLNLVLEAAQLWQLESYIPQIRQIQRINETLKENKLKGNTGGVPLDWYYLAFKYLEHHPGLENIRKVGEELICFIVSKIESIIAEYEMPDGWDDLRQWVRLVVMLPQQINPQNSLEQSQIFLKELDSYNHAKKDGRGRQLICSLSNSAYTVTEQMESAVLFTPQVYTNKQRLNGSNAKRNISSIAGTEMMLRQILMNQTQTVGKRFEDGKYRYLYFYPTYYFTSETNNFLQQAYIQIAQTRFDTSIRNHFISKELNADFSRDRYQTIDAFIINENLHTQTQLPTDDPNHKTDRTFKLSYPDDKPLTFYFMALPPGRDPTDTESWVMPTWLALAFPLILDVKTVVSESPIPPYRDGSEFEETVFLDSAPQAFRVLTQGDRFRLDYILEGWSDANGKEHPAPLNVLTAAYSIHLDVNAKRGKTGYDANWGKLTELASNLETSPLYVFHYLKQWTRGKDTDIPSISRIRLYTYDFYPCFDPYIINIDKNTEEITLSKESALNHPLNLTLMYRKFYRANKQFAPKSNAVLKPIDVAAKTLLDADLSFQGSTLHDSLSDIEPAYQGKGIVATVASELNKLMDRVHSSTAEGRWVFNRQQRDKEQEAILAFARYFVVDVFENSFKGDRARLAGRQLNLLRDTCEFLYRLEQDKENRQNPRNNSEEESN